MLLNYQIQHVPRRFIQIGSVDFTNEYMTLGREGVFDLYDPEFADFSAFAFMRNALERINGGINYRYGSSVRLVGGQIEDGSIKYKDGQLVVEGKFLAAAVIGISLVNGYGTLRSSIPIVVDDILSVVEFAAQTADMANIYFNVGDTNEISREVKPYLPFVTRRRLEDEEDQEMNYNDDVFRP